MPKRRYERGIKCPQCGHYTTDVSWTEPATGHILRHRKCHREGCQGELTTIERPVHETPESLAESIGKALRGDFRQIAESVLKRD